MNIIQLREGSFGRFSSHEGGMPVYSSAARIPDFCFGMGTSGAAEPVGLVSLIGGRGRCIVPVQRNQTERGVKQRFYRGAFAAQRLIVSMHAPGVRDHQLQEINLEFASNPTSSICYVYF